MAPSTCRGLARLIWGLTSVTRQRITNGYSQFLRRPLVYLDLVEQRPVRVTVTGQVLRSGVFTLPVDSQRGAIGAHRRWCRWWRLANHGGRDSESRRDFRHGGFDPSRAASRLTHSRWADPELRL